MTGPAIGLDLAPSDSLASIELRRVRLLLREPFVAAHGTEHDREVVLVHVVGDDGAHGWGECVALREPTYTAETTDSAWVALRDLLVPAVLTGAVDPEPGHPMAWAAVEAALVDLALRRSGCSLIEALGASARPIEACAVVGLHPTVDATVAAVARRVEDGYGAVKLKIEPGRDLDRLAAVRVAFPDVGLAADANGSFTVDDRSRLASFGAIGLDYLEQPLAADAIDGLARLRRALPFPVALDESVASLPDLERVIAAEAGSVLNLKPGRVGGLLASAAILGAATDAGWAVFVGGMLETGIGRATALAVASHDACTLPTDLGPSARYFEHDVTEPIRLEPGARLRAPEGPGIGVVPDDERLAAATIDLVELAS